MTRQATPARIARNASLRAIMRGAWTIFRKEGGQFGNALRKAWAWAKRKGVAAPTAAQGLRTKLVRETEKAVLLLVEIGSHCGSRLVEAWLPKKGAVASQDGNNVFVSAWGEKMLKEKLSVGLGTGRWLAEFPELI